MAKRTSLDELLGDIEAGNIRPLYLVHGDLVVAQPQAASLAKALSEKACCEVESYRRPPTLAPILADLKTYSLFASAKVVLVLDSAIIADTSGAAELIDQAADVLPLTEGADAQNDAALREASSRLLQALRVFAVDPGSGLPADAVEALPKWALQGGKALRKRHPRGRPAKAMKTLREGLAELVEAALEAGLVGHAEGDLAELGNIVANGLPPGHALVLAESSVAAEHPVLASLKAQGTVLELGQVSAGKRGGDWQGLDLLIEELVKELDVRIARDAAAELARRTLRQTGDFKNRSVGAESTSRFAGELRKLAGLARGKRITRQLVVQSVEDRGEQDVWEILDAVGKADGVAASTMLRRYLAAADDVVAARLSFFAVLVRFCRQLVAVGGLVKLLNVPWGEHNYNRFKDRWAGVLQDELPHGGRSPVAGVHPFQLFRAYQTASTMSAGELARLPSWVLETELRIKGDSSQADTALSQLMGRVVQLIQR